MNAFATRNPAIRAGHVSHDSPKVHRDGVKHETAEKGVNIERKKNSLSCFTLSPAPSRLRVYARDGGERVNHGNLGRRFLGDLRADVCHGWPTFATARVLAPRSQLAAGRDTWPTGGPRRVCQSGRRKTSWRPANGSFPAKFGPRRPWEQRPS